MIPFLVLLLAFYVGYHLWLERHHPAWEDCPSESCRLWIGDPAWEGKPRTCPKCRATMLPKGTGPSDFERFLSAVALLFFDVGIWLCFKEAVWRDLRAASIRACRAKVTP